MAQFKPVMVQNKSSLSKIDYLSGQYIVVIDENELYLDNPATQKREKVSQNVYTQATEPTNAKTGDIWFVAEE